VISPEEAENVVQEQWATAVQHQINAGIAFLPSPSESSNASGSNSKGGIVVMKFSRFTERLESALLNCRLAQNATRSGVDVQPKWGNGSKIFIEGLGPQHLEEPIMEEELRPWHVILYEADVAQVEEAIVQLPYRFRKVNGRLALPNKLSLCQVSPEVSSCSSSKRPDDDHDDNDDDDDDDDLGSELVPGNNESNVIEYVVKNTFIEFDSNSQTSFMETRPRTI